jgi:hypothetical protein
MPMRAVPQRQPSIIPIVNLLCRAEAIIAQIILESL